MARHGADEEEENRWLGAQLRVVYGLMRDREAPQYQPVRNAWQLLPPEVRARMAEDGFEALGGVAGGMAANHALLLGAGWIGGRMVARIPRLQPMMVLGRPAAILAGAVLGAFVLQGAAAQLLQRQRQLFARFPGSEQSFKDAVDKANKGPPK